jgi:subtilisin family serine protease
VLHARTRRTLALAAGVLVLAPASAVAQEIEGQYIVVFKNQASKAEGEATKGKVRREGGRVQHEYSRVLKGFSAKLDAQALEEVRNDPNVAFVEPDRVISLNTTQTPATWGLDRIDQRALPLNNTYSYTPTGSGVKAYIIDTGIRTSHQQFGGRAISGFDAVDGGAADDCNGHGTHVAGTVGGATYGVAKSVTLVAVRVLNCGGSGTNSGVIAGIDWVTGNHAAGERAVANMSLGGGASSAIDNAVTNSINDGVTYAIAAGNSNANACNSSPARTPAAITVGSTTSGDARSSFSNYGTCLDIFAPGSSITSAWSTSDTATNTISGTSMATPHVAGVAALALSTNPAYTPAEVRDLIVNTATNGVVTNPGTGSPNRLLYSPLTPGGTQPPPTGCGPSTTRSLSGTGASISHPYTTTVSGTHKGCLAGPSGTDFDLYLQRWNGSRYATVAYGESSSSVETVTYNGAAGQYRWLVYSFRGSGSYTLQFTRP